MITYFLPIIILLGIVTSYTDLKKGKIKNNHLIAAMAAGIIVYLLLVISKNITDIGLNVQNYFFFLTINFIFSCIFSIFFWYFDIWSAGDSKLFAVYSFLIPLTSYSADYAQMSGEKMWFPASILLINLFVISFIALLIYLSFYLISEKKSAKVLGSLIFSAKQTFTFKKIITSCVAVFSLFWIIGFILDFVRIKSDYFLIFAVSFAVSYLAYKFFNEKTNLVLFFIAAIRLIFDWQIRNMLFLESFLLTILVWIILREILDTSLLQLSNGVFSKNIDSKELKEGMLLAESVVVTNKRPVKLYEDIKAKKNIEIIHMKNKYYIKKEPEAFEKAMLEGGADGLTKRDVQQLKKIGFRNFKIANTIPFAPLIFICVIITIIVKENILIYFANTLIP